MNAGPPVPLPDLEDPAELDSTIVAFAQCVEESFPIVVRYRPDAFIGMITEVTSQLRDEGDLVDVAVADCNARFDLDRRIGAYQAANEISEDQNRSLVAGFVSCADGVSPTVSELVSDARLLTHVSVGNLVADLSPGRAGLTGDELVAVSECASDMTGPEHVFSSGHSWFTR